MGSTSPDVTSVQFYAHPQSAALTTFLPTLRPYLPQSNPLYNRLSAPHNVPSRHCLFAATFPPSSVPDPKDNFTIVFADRSRPFKSQIWLFNPLISLKTPLSPTQDSALVSTLHVLIQFLKNIQIPDAPGWPFLPTLKFGAVHETIAERLKRVGEERDALGHCSEWNTWLTSLPELANKKPTRSLPPDFSIAKVPEDQLGVVISTSKIPRLPSTLLLLPSVGILDSEGVLAAWGYIGIDGDFATLHTQPAYRGRGLASIVAFELLQSLTKGDYKDLGFDGETGWIVACVHDGNAGSERVMRALGARVEWKAHYVWIESEKF